MKSESVERSRKADNTVDIKAMAMSEEGNSAVFGKFDWHISDEFAEMGIKILNTISSIADYDREEWSVREGGDTGRLQLEEEYERACQPLQDYISTTMLDEDLENGLNANDLVKGVFDVDSER